jgi:hypothetical protein
MSVYTCQQGHNRTSLSTHANSDTVKQVCLHLPTGRQSYKSVYTCQQGHNRTSLSTPANETQSNMSVYTCQKDTVEQFCLHLPTGNSGTSLSTSANRDSEEQVCLHLPTVTQSNTFVYTCQEGHSQTNLSTLANIDKVEQVRQHMPTSGTVEYVCLYMPKGTQSNNSVYTCQQGRCRINLSTPVQRDTV